MRQRADHTLIQPTGGPIVDLFYASVHTKPGIFQSSPERLILTPVLAALLPSYKSGGGIADWEVLTIAEIEARFESEWVLIEDPSTDDFLKVRGGTVRPLTSSRCPEVISYALSRPARFCR